MKRVLSIIMLLALVFSIGIISTSVASENNWSFATIQIALDENIACAKYDVWVYLDDELVDIVKQGGITTFDVLLTRGQHQLKLVPDSLLADAKVWTFSINRPSYTLDCSLQAHILYLQYNRYSISEGNGGISHEEKSRILDRAEEGASFIRILTSF